MTNTKTVRLSLRFGTNLVVFNNVLFDGEPKIKVVDPLDDEDEENTHYPSATLKDLSLIMFYMVGQGLTWQLADELSKRLDISKELVSKTLFDIWKEYQGLDDSEDAKRWEGFERPNAE